MPSANVGPAPVDDLANRQSDEWPPATRPSLSGLPIRPITLFIWYSPVGCLAGEPEGAKRPRTAGSVQALDTSACAW